MSSGALQRQTVNNAEPRECGFAHKYRVENDYTLSVFYEMIEMSPPSVSTLQCRPWNMTGFVVRYVTAVRFCL